MSGTRFGCITVGCISVLAVEIAFISVLEELSPHHVLHGPPEQIMAFVLGALGLGVLLGMAASK